MKAFGKIESRFWDSLRHEQVSDQGKLLAAYLLTCKHGNMLGIFSLPPAYIMGDLGWDASLVSRTLHELVTNEFLTTAEDHDYLCINKFMDHNKTDNVAQMDARLRLFLDLPRTLPRTLPPVMAIVEQELLKASNYKASKDTPGLIEQVREWFGNGSSKVRLENKRNREIENCLKTNGTSDDVPGQSDVAPAAPEFPDHFEQWWSQYPKREGRKGHKRQSYGKYKTRIREGVSQEVMLDNVMRYASYCDQTGKTGTEYVMQTLTYLNDPDNIISKWIVNHENRQGTAEKSSLIDQVYQANKHLYEPAHDTGYHPENDSGPVWNHDGHIRGEVDTGARTGGQDGAVAGNPEGLAPQPVGDGD